MINKIFICVLAACALISCAKEVDESERSIQERVLNSYVELYCPNATIKDNGLVLLDYQQGTGDTLDLLEAGFFEYTTQMLSGNYAETTDEELAKRLGWYSNANYYGPSLFEVGYQVNYAGLEEMMLGMQVGGKAKFIMPPWLSYTSNKNVSNLTVNYIYEIELKEVVENVLQWQEDTMKAYANIHYPGLDTTSANFYFKKLYDSGKDTVSSSADVRYVGRLLDGWVFDTNIADTAKKYGIYDSSKDYAALSVPFSDELDNMVQESSLVKGFCMALQKMNHEDEAFTMFYSEYGYSYSGSGSIGPYQPLIFWIYIEPKE